MSTFSSSAAKAVILFGHGARDPEWAGPMQRIRATMLAAAPDAVVELAFLEFMSPTLDVAVDELVARGVTQIVLVPVFLAQGGHLKRDLPMLVDAARARHPGCTFELGLAVGEAPGVVAAIAEYGLQALR